jgi:PLP dependent protein
MTNRIAIERNLASVRSRIAAAARRAGRDESDIRLVAISKAFPSDVLLDAVAAGVSDLGENRAQELRDKLRVVGDGARWHFVGHLQTNKVRHVAGAVALIHSVDRFGLAEAIARRTTAIDAIQDVLIEVKLAGEDSKHGAEAPTVIALAEAIADLEGVRLKGLMTIPPLPASPEDSRPYFRQLAAIGDSLADRFPDATDLSMGMTRDFEVAVEEGATIVRVGEAIFGPRP